MGKSGLKVRENHEMGRKGYCFCLSLSMCWFGEEMATAPKSPRCRHNVGDGSGLRGVEIESCRRMIKAFMVFSKYIRYFMVLV